MGLWFRLGRAAYWLAWPALFFYLRIGARTRVLVLAEDHVLLVQGWMSDGRWSLPGGGMHRREAPVAAVIRETAEETSVHLLPEQLKQIGGERWSGNGLTFYCYCFAAELGERHAVRRQRGEIVAAEWIPMSRLAALRLTPEVHHALELLAAAG